MFYLKKTHRHTHRERETIKVAGKPIKRIEEACVCVRGEREESFGSIWNVGGQSFWSSANSPVERIARKWCRECVCVSLSISLVCVCVFGSKSKACYMFHQCLLCVCVCVHTEREKERRSQTDRELLSVAYYLVGCIDQSVYIKSLFFLLFQCLALSSFTRWLLKYIYIYVDVENIRTADAIYI